MKAVIRNGEQLHNIYLTFKDAIPEQGLLLEITEYKPPRSLRQNRKLHAMITDLNNFTARDDMKDFIKRLEFWPKVLRPNPFTDEMEMMPKSEKALTREEESEIIEGVYAMVAMHLEPIGFKWKHV